MDYICPHCGLEYHIMEEYIATYKEEGKRCGCGEVMVIAPEKTEYVI
jgi:hypothetical protein